MRLNSFACSAVTSETRLSRILTLQPSERPIGIFSDGSVLTLRGFLAGTAAWRDAALALPPDTRENAVLYSEDALELLPALFGFWAAGVHAILPGDILPGTLKHLEDSGVALDKTFLALGAIGMDDGKRVVHLFSPVERTSDFNALEAPHDLGLLDDKAPLLSLLTSGSTGKAKLCRKRLEQAFLEPESIDAGIPGGTSALGAIEVLGTVSAQHIYGLLFRALWPLLSTEALIVGKRLHYPENLEEALKEAKARGHRAVVIAAPAHLKRFTDPTLFEDARDCVILAFSSTGPLDDEGARVARAALGLFPMEVLGSTETGGIAWRRRDLESDGKISTPPWKTVPGITAGVRLEDGRVLPEGEGLLTLSGRHLDHDGWNDGSDRIRLDDTGFTLLGRADRIVKIEGKRVALPEVEALLVKGGLAREAKVFAFGEGRREALAAVLKPSPQLKDIFLADGKAAAVRNLREELGRNLPAVSIPRRWRLVDELPANAQGKTTVKALESLFDPRRPEWLLESDEVQEDSRHLRLRLEASPGLEWFKGHFPGLPILPGVAQLLLVEKAFRAYAHVSGDFNATQVKTLKFRAVTTPGMRLALELECPVGISSEESFSLKFAWKKIGDSEDIQSSGTIVFARK